MFVSQTVCSVRRVNGCEDGRPTFDPEQLQGLSYSTFGIHPMPCSSALNITWDRHLSDWLRVRRSWFDCHGEGGQSRPVLVSVISFPGEQNGRTTNLITHIHLILRSRINVAFLLPLPLAPNHLLLVLMLRLRHRCLVVTAILV